MLPDDQRLEFLYFVHEEYDNPDRITIWAEVDEWTAPVLDGDGSGDAGRSVRAYVDRNTGTVLQYSLLTRDKETRQDHIAVLSGQDLHRILESHTLSWHEHGSRHNYINRILD